jgi:hypothetical protein
MLRIRKRQRGPSLRARRGGSALAPPEGWTILLVNTVAGQASAAAAEAAN